MMGSQAIVSLPRTDLSHDAYDDGVAGTGSSQAAKAKAHPTKKRSQGEGCYYEPQEHIAKLAP